MRASKWQAAVDRAEQLRAERLAAMPVKVSVVMATHNKPTYLARTLDSIIRQRPDFNCEVIVVDDGSAGNETEQVCKVRGVTYLRIDRAGEYRNPGPARNLGYRHAKGEVVIAQSDDVVHEQIDSLQRLSELKQGEMHFATVWNASFSQSGIMMRRLQAYTAKDINERPLFFLGSIYRKDLFSVGCNDECFSLAGYEDQFLGDCLLRIPLSPVYRTDVTAYHQDHPRPRLRNYYTQMESVYLTRIAECEHSGKWCSSSGPWKYENGKSAIELQS